MSSSYSPHTLSVFITSVVGIYSRKDIKRQEHCKHEARISHQMAIITGCQTRVDADIEHLHDIIAKIGAHKKSEGEESVCDAQDTSAVNLKLEIGKWAWI